MKKLLIVDDEAKIRELVRKYAVYQGFLVDEAENGSIAVKMCEDKDYDLIIMDVMMPVMNGYDASQFIRENKDIPIIMLTARDSEFDKYQGFELGIDDYVVKPFSPRELLYRVEAVLKRIQKHKGAESFAYEGLHIDYLGRHVSIDGARIDLSLKEYQLLTYLVENKNIALEREQILNRVWGYDFFGDDRTLDTHIKRLRQKIAPYQHLIVTLRGVGYRFETI